ncbi:MAG: response regulator transcription factor [Saprospiraceae bacterium]
MTFGAILKTWWASILLYGVALGLLLASLQFAQYRIFTLGKLDERNMGLIALLFTIVGVWAGKKMNRSKQLLPVGQAIAKRPPQEILAQTGITPRELEVLEQIAQGLSNLEIAEKLFVSVNTVKTHTSNVFSKLSAQRRTQAIQRAKDLGLLP